MLKKVLFKRFVLRVSAFLMIFSLLIAAIVFTRMLLPIWSGVLASIYVCFAIAFSTMLDIATSTVFNFDGRCRDCGIDSSECSGSCPHKVCAVDRALDILFLHVVIPILWPLEVAALALVSPFYWIIKFAFSDKRG